MRVGLVISSLGRGGGAERVMATMASYWVNHGWAVTVVALAGNTDDWYPIPETVAVKCLNLVGDSQGLFEGLSNNALRIIGLRRALREVSPDVIVSFIDRMNIMTLIATLRLGRPVIVAERSTPWRHDPGGLWRMLRRFVYPLADRVVVQTEAVRKGISYVKPRRLEVIPNPAPAARHESRGENENAAALLRGSLANRPYVLGVGRLDPAKGFDLLLRAFAVVADRFPNLQLVIVGEGAQRVALQELAAELGLSEKTIMPGLVKDPLAIMRGAKLFVLSSRYEGFPNALLEAMSVGTASISFDCEHGPADLIRHGQNGLLVPPEDLHALAAAMRSVLGDESTRSRLAAAAAEISRRLSVDRIMAQWSDVVRAVASERPVR